MDRLKKRAEFLAAARGLKIPRRGFVLQVRERKAEADSKARFGFTVTKKVGNAVVRNRVKRRLRAVARQLEVHALKGHDYVLIGRKATLAEPFASLLNDFRKTLERVARDKQKNVGQSGL